MSSFQYEWWTVRIQEPTGQYLMEFKGKNKETVIRQINKYVAETNSQKNLAKPWWERKSPIQEVFWDTLKLDHVGYQRLY